MQSTFRPDGGAPTDELQGELSFSVPPGCEDRTIRWEIAVDGERIGHGTLTGLPTYRPTSDYPLDHSPRKVTVSARWDGGSGSCPSFGAVWKTPELSRAFDLFLGL